MLVRVYRAAEQVLVSRDAHGIETLRQASAALDSVLDWHHESHALDWTAGALAESEPAAHCEPAHDRATVLGQTFKGAVCATGCCLALTNDELGGAAATAGNPEPARREGHDSS